MVTEALAGAHEGNRAAPRWAAVCSCGSGAGLKGRARRLELNHQFSTWQNKEGLPQPLL